MSEFKPGDVALVVHAGHTSAAIASGETAGGACWWTVVDRDGDSLDVHSNDDDFTVIRRLAVIDPEDDEQVNHLADLLHDHAVRDALREYTSPTPPKPDEPMGLGAVVDDAAGHRWVRVFSEDSPRPWRKANLEPGKAMFCAWGEITPKTVHDHGWLPEAVQR